MEEWSCCVVQRYNGSFVCICCQIAAGWTDCGLWRVLSFSVFGLCEDITPHRRHWCSVDRTNHAGLWCHALALYASTSIVAVFVRMSLSDTSAVCWPTLKSLWPVRASTYLHMIAFICLMTSCPFWIQASKQIDLFVSVCVCVCVWERDSTRVCEWEKDSVRVCVWAEGAALEAAQVL